MSKDPNRIDLPFEEQPEQPMIDLASSLAAGGVVILASKVTLEDGSVMAGIVYRFIAPTGEFYPPMVLAMDDDGMRTLPGLTMRAVATARRAAGA
jgi:hypothetical protein